MFRTAPAGTSPAMNASADHNENPGDKPFDRNLRRTRRDRAFAGWAEHAFLQQAMAEELAERLDTVQRDFSRALILGHSGDALPRALESRTITHITADPGFSFAESDGGIQCDEDRLPFAAESFDLVLSAGLLDTVNDLPGALHLIRRVLRPDGLFLGACLGAGSLPVLRSAMHEADMVSGRAAPRIHPQIDIRAAGDLLGRAGFALQVADCEELTVRFSSFGRLIGDLRGSANSSLLGGPPLSKSAYAAAAAAFESAQVDGKTAEKFAILYLTGWAPSPDQPKAAVRGSGTASLADVLKPKS
ncbi:methyltransferase domain-containing protein [Parasphingopyxis marina]|uniref:methyltransferase domain-containing protein n=1 Tax=Parasphingopyxis marina TaxID=2761622 RepID=UPI0038B3270B